MFFFAPVVGNCSWKVRIAYALLLLVLMGGTKFATNLLWPPVGLSWWVVIPVVAFATPFVLWFPFAPFVDRSETRMPLTATLHTGSGDKINLKYPR